jgi:hypothetical protein
VLEERFPCFFLNAVNTKVKARHLCGKKKKGYSRAGNILLWQQYYKPVSFGYGPPGIALRLNKLLNFIKVDG